MSDAKPQGEKKTSDSKPERAFWYVLDTTASDVSGPRHHQMIVEGITKTFTFEHGKPLKLTIPIAIKFLKHDAFRRTNAKGDPLPYERRPTQPNELGAGERFVLKIDQTIAYYEELSNIALLQRVLELPLGERFSETEDREGMISFLIETAKRVAAENTAKDPDIGKEDFVPIADLDEEGIAA